MLQLIEELERIVGDPQVGLPEPVFRLVSRLTPLVNVDLLIKDASHRTLLTWREDEIYGRGWHVPGGIVRFRESLHERIREVAKWELGAEVKSESPGLVHEFIEPHASTRGHFISLLFRCVLISAPDEIRRWRVGRPRPGEWCWHTGSPADLIAAQAAYRPYI